MKSQYRPGQRRDISPGCGFSRQSQPCWLNWVCDYLELDAVVPAPAL